MRKQQFLVPILLLPALAICNLQPATILAQDTAFSYQGRLNAGGGPANGIYDLSFAIYDSTNTPGNLLAGPLTNSATGVTNGLFLVTLDFGSGVFMGSNCWLEIGVRTNGGDAFATLVPRQPILPVPYAIYSPNAGSAAYATSAGTATSAGSATVASSIGSVSAGNVAQLNVPNTNATAIGTLTIFNGFVVAANVVNGGSGYLSAPIVSVTDAIGSNAVIVAAVSGSGAVTNLAVQSAGVNYSSNAVLVIAPPPSSAIQTFGTINNFTGVNTFSGALNANNLYLPTTTAAAGIIYSGGNTLIHAYGSQNFFAGWGAGNLTLTGNQSTGLGYEALKSDTSGGENTAVGYHALLVNTTGSGNTGVGSFAFRYNTTGNNNTAVGFQALDNNTSGSANEAIGQNALDYNTTGSQNMAAGDWALYANTTGSQNTASGSGALQNNTTGGSNTADGFHTLFENTSGSDNVAIGRAALYWNNTGNNNLAVGNGAMSGSTSGSGNVATGVSALQNNTTGNNNVADGFQALWSNATGSNNIALGYNAGYNITNGSSNIDIGNLGRSTDTNIIRIGAGQAQAFIAGVITGNGGGLTNLNASQFGGGVLPLAQLPGDVALLDASQTFTGLNVFSTNVAIGTASTPERLEVAGQDTAYSGGCSIRIHDTKDTIGGFVGDGWLSLQFGMYNPSASPFGVVPAGGKWSLFGFDYTGKVGSLETSFGNPAYRNLLDDGNGNMSVAGMITGNGGGLTNIPAIAITGGVNTNILIGGHTFFITNGIIMAVQ